jgi:nucleoside-triphosphatase THEP1
MPRLEPAAPIVAIIYGDGARVGPVIASIASHLAVTGCRLAGLIQRDRVRAGRSRCDMLMEDLTSGSTIAISQDRGEGARGCRLDVEALIDAIAHVRTALVAQPDLLIVNKFGKTECEGGGCRSLIAEAVELGVPVLVAVPYANLEVWRNFAGDLAAEHVLADLPADTVDLCRSLALTTHAGSPRTSPFIAIAIPCALDS